MFVLDVNKHRTLLQRQLPNTLSGSVGSAIVGRHDLASQSGHW